MVSSTENRISDPSSLTTNAISKSINSSFLLAAMDNIGRLIRLSSLGGQPV